MDYREGSALIKGYRRDISATRAKLRDVQRNIEPQPVADRVFSTAGGTARLLDLFGRKSDLFVIHNMGRSCPYCTLWADGYNGFYDHIADRAALVVASPDPPDVQRAFAASRGWRFPMVSDGDKAFAAAMGYIEDGSPLPGVSAFKRRNGEIVRVADTSFNLGDDFCALFHFLDLLPEGRDGWAPRFKYR